MTFNDLLDELEKCINNKTYYAALALSLIIPDVCSQVLCGLDKGNGKLYRQWFDDYVGKKEDMMYQAKMSDQHKITGDIMYGLRNSVFHCGLPTTNKKQNYIFYFEMNESSTLYRSYTEMTGEIKVTINVPYVCKLLYKAGKDFYINNEDKFPSGNDWRDALPNFMKSMYEEYA